MEKSSSLHYVSDSRALNSPESETSSQVSSSRNQGQQPPANGETFSRARQVRSAGYRQFTSPSGTGESKRRVDEESNKTVKRARNIDHNDGKITWSCAQISTAHGKHDSPGERSSSQVNLDIPNVGDGSTSYVGNSVNPVNISSVSQSEQGLISNSHYTVSAEVFAPLAQAMQGETKEELVHYKSNLDSGSEFQEKCKEFKEKWCAEKRKELRDKLINKNDVRWNNEQIIEKSLDAKSLDAKALSYLKNTDFNKKNAIACIKKDAIARIKKNAIARIKIPPSKLITITNKILKIYAEYTSDKLKNGHVDELDFNALWYHDTFKNNASSKQIIYLLRKLDENNYNFNKVIELISNDIEAKKTSGENETTREYRSSLGNLTSKLEELNKLQEKHRKFIENVKREISTLEECKNDFQIGDQPAQSQHQLQSEEPIQDPSEDPLQPIGNFSHLLSDYAAQEVESYIPQAGHSHDAIYDQTESQGALNEQLVQTRVSSEGQTGEIVWDDIVFGFEQHES